MEMKRKMVVMLKLRLKGRLKKRRDKNKLKNNRWMKRKKVWKIRRKKRN
jgi:hypothetical protein